MGNIPDHREGRWRWGWIKCALRGHGGARAWDKRWCEVCNKGESKSRVDN